jgi:LPS export ABC transporter protein LptC
MLKKCKYLKLLAFNYTFYLISCSSEPIQQNLLQKEIPDQESWDVTITLSEKGIMRAKIKSGHLEKYHEKSFVFLDSNVIIDFFDRNEQHTSILNSKYAEVNQKSNNMKASGHVVAISDSGITLFSESLIWDAKKEKLYTDERIMITTLEKDTLYGVGFESNSDLKNWKILHPSGVSGKAFN